MTTREALDALGAHPSLLTPRERDRLDRDGYLALHGVLPPDRLTALRERVDRLLDEEGQRGGHELGYTLDPNDNTLADLINKDPIFHVVLTEPRVLAGIASVLTGEFKLSSLNFRAPSPGHGRQHLHPDWEEPVRPGEYLVCNSIWLLDDFTEENGATRIVPGSHRSGRMPRDEMADPDGDHPDEIKIVAPAGTVAIFNGHVWHGGTLNQSASRRRAMHGYFCRRDQEQQLDQRRFIRPGTLAQLSAAARFMLDV